MGLNFLGVAADAAYKALPDSCQALWTDDGIDGRRVDNGIEKLAAMKPWKC